MSQGTETVVAGIAEKQDSWCRPDIFFLILLICDLTIRGLAAGTHKDYIDADMLAPFSLADAIVHREMPNLGRQQLLLPAVIGSLAHLFGSHPGLSTLLHLCNCTTAMASSLTLVPLYLLARRRLGPWHALGVAVLLSTNASFGFASWVLNPTQVYALLFTTALWLIDRFECRPSVRVLMGIAVVAGLAYLVRHEGLLLVVIVMAYMLWAWWTGQASGQATLAALSIATFSVVLGWGTHQVFTRQIFAFLANTHATDKPGSVFHYSFRQLVELTLQSIQWKAEKMTALATNATIVGLMVAALGFGKFFRKHSFATVVLAYVTLYEVVMFVFTMMVPVGEPRHLQLLEVYNPLSVPRYYQIYTPFLCLFGYAALLMLIPNVGRRRTATAACVATVLAFSLYQGTLGYYTYSLRVASMRKNPDVDFAFELSDFFRKREIRTSGMLITTLEGGRLKVARETSYYCHPVLLSILTGNNDVNCWGFDLERPNISCFERYHSDSPDLLIQTAHEKIEYLVVRGNPQAALEHCRLQEQYRSPRLAIYRIDRLAR